MNVYYKPTIFSLYDILRKVIFQQVNVELIKRISEGTYLSTKVFRIWR